MNKKINAYENYGIQRHGIKRQVLHCELIFSKIARVAQNTHRSQETLHNTLQRFDFVEQYVTNNRDDC